MDTRPANIKAIKLADIAKAASGVPFNDPDDRLILYSAISPVTTAAGINMNTTKLNIPNMRLHIASLLHLDELLI